MTWQQLYGSATALNPPVVVGGVSYGAAVVFSSAPAQGSSEPTICTGNFDEAPSEPVPGRKSVICRRAMQQFSYTDVRGAGDASEITYGALMGGNVAATTEPERGYSWVGERSFRGDDSHDRARPGDVLWWNGRGFLVSDVEPFAVAPSLVNWAGDEPLQVVWTVRAEPNDLRLDPPDRVTHPDAWTRFDTTGTGPFHDCGLYVWDEGSTSYVPMDHTIFADDEEIYPRDATMDAGAYWFDGLGLEFRVGTDSGTNDLAAVWFESGRRLVDAVFGDQIVLAGAGTGYAEDDDALSLASGVTRDDFVLSMYVYEQQGAGFGNGAIEWRQGLAADAAVIACEWAGPVIQRVAVRSSSGGVLADVAIEDVFPMTGPFFIVRITKSGGTFSVHISDDGSTFEPVVTGVALTGVVAKTYGLFSVAAWGGNAVRVGPPTGGIGLADLGAGTGELSVQRIKTWTGAGYTQSVTLPTAAMIDRVDNLTSGLLMLEGDPGRGGYSIESGKIVLYSEAAGDMIRVRHVAEGSPPSPPGRPGRFHQAVNMGTFQEDGETSTTSTAENVGNWRDRLTVIDTHDELAAIAGEEFEIKRNPRFDPLDPPALHYSVRDGEADAWQALPEGSYLLREVEGIVLLASAFLASVEGQLCIRASGKRYSQAGNMQARQINDIGKAIEALDELWCQVGSTHLGDGVGGTGEARGPLPSGFTCLDCFDVDYTGFEIGGHTRGIWGGRMDALAAFGVGGFPYWQTAGTVRYVAFGDPTGLTVANTDVWHECCPGGPGGWNENQLGYPAVYIDVQPFGSITETQHFGSTLIFEDLGDANYGGVSFSFSGLALEIGDVLSRLPEGTVCVEAKMPVKFDGFQGGTWECSKYSVNWYASPAHTYTHEVRFNGNLYQRKRVVDGVTAEETDNSASVEFLGPSAPIAFTLIGRRRASQNVYVPPDDAWYAVPAGLWHSIGGGGIVAGGTASDGKWRVIDVTNVVNALLRARKTQLVDFQLWPSRPGISPGTSVDGMAAFAKGLYPTESVEHSVTVIEGARLHTQTYTYAGGYVRWENLQAGAIMARFRLPGGTDLVLPIEQRPV